MKLALIYACMLIAFTTMPQEKKALPDFRQGSKCKMKKGIKPPDQERGPVDPVQAPRGG
jgi:hypothetical protein